MSMQPGSARRSLARQPVNKTSSLGYTLDGIAIFLAILIVVFPFPREWIEDVYANGLFASLNRALVPLSDSVPVSIGDVEAIVAIAIVIIAWIAKLSSTERYARRRETGKLVLHTLGWIALGVIVFEALWGMNYRRPTVIDRIVFDGRRVNAQSVSEFSAQIVGILNRDVGAAHAEKEIDRVKLAAAFEPVVNRLGDDWDVALSLPKFTILQPYYDAAGIGGQYAPFSFETYLNTSFLRIEAPRALAHEWAHVAGFTDEGDANYIGTLTCLRSDDPLIRYSGAFWTYAELPDAQRRALKLDPRVLADFRASRARYLKHFVPALSGLQWHLYDGYLRGSGVRGGVASYGYFLRLLVGTQLDSHGLPLVKRMQNPI